MNQCHYCAVQVAHENAKMLAIQAGEGDSPELLIIVGTRAPILDPKPFYNARRLVMRALRRRWPAEYASLLEFTTGMASTSGGLRRPHWNLFMRGIPAEDVDEARQLVRDVWCRHIDAEPEAQYVEVVRDAAAAAKYVALHFQKESQAPPEGWRGQRFNCSRGFFPGRTVTEMRALARAELRRDRETWRVAQEMPEASPEAQAEAVNAALAWKDGHEWTMVATDPRRAEDLLAGREPRQLPTRPDHDVVMQRLRDRHEKMAHELALVAELGALLAATDETGGVARPGPAQSAADRDGEASAEPERSPAGRGSPPPAQPAHLAQLHLDPPVPEWW